MDVMRTHTHDKKFIDYGSRYYDWQIQTDPFCEATPCVTEPERYFNRRVELTGCNKRDPDIHIDDASEIYKFFSQLDSVGACPDLDIWVGREEEGFVTVIKVAERSATIILTNA